MQQQEEQTKLDLAEDLVGVGFFFGEMHIFTLWDRMGPINSEDEAGNCDPQPIAFAPHIACSLQL